jgi:putative transposase
MTISFKQRPPRLRLIYENAPLYFVTFCTYERRSLLAFDVVHQEFRKAAECVCAVGNAVGRYVIMPDHIHLFLRIGTCGRLGLAVKCLREAITKRLHADQPDLRIWQAGFFDHMMRSGESYAEKWLYVRNNPVRAGLCANADKWPYQGEIVVIRW